MSEEQIKKFLIEIQKNRNLFDKVKSVPTANEIALIANELGFDFTGKELKNINRRTINGIKIRSQDTSPSYNFGEGGN